MNALKSKSSNLLAFLCTAVVLGVSALQSFAVDSAYVSDITDAATQIGTDLATVIGAALAIVVIVFGVKMGVRVFKGIASKG